MTTEFNSEAYGQLLREVLPQVIKTEQEYDRVLPIVDRLVFKKDNTPEEAALLNLLALLVETYETEHYPMDESEPHEILQHILNSSDVTAEELIGVVGFTMGEVTDVLNGSRGITKEMATNLGELFKISRDLFL